MKKTFKLVRCVCIAMSLCMGFVAHAADPKPPTPKASQGKYTYVKVTWSKVSNASQGYYIFRAESPSWSAASLLVKIPSKSTVSYKDKSVKSGVKYYYWVCPLRNGYYYYNESRYCKGYAKKKASSDPVPPTPKATLDTYTYVKVSWSKVSNANQGYYIFRAESPSWSAASLLAKISSKSTVSYNDKSAKGGVKYYYWVCPLRNGYYYYNESRYCSGRAKVSQSSSFSIKGTSSLSVGYFNYYSLEEKGKLVISGVSWSGSSNILLLTQPGGRVKVVINTVPSGSTSTATLKATYKGKTYSKKITLYRTGSYGDARTHGSTTYSGRCSRHGYWTSNRPGCPYCRGELDVW